jgi:putative tricarboxylic transport membrane protein
MTADRLAGLALVLIGIAAVWESRAFPVGSLHRPGPAFMPLLLAVLLIAFGVAVAALGAGSTRVGDLAWPEWRHAVAILLAAAFAAWGLDRLGYRLTMALVLAALFLVVERLRLVTGLALTLSMAWGSFYLFDGLLKVPLPRGPLGL